MISLNRFPELLLIACLMLAGIAVHAVPQLVMMRFGRADMMWTCLFWMVPVGLWILREPFSFGKRTAMGVGAVLLAGLIQVNLMMPHSSRLIPVQMLSPFGFSQLTSLLFTVCVASVIAGMFRLRSESVRSTFGVQEHPRQAGVITGGILLLAACVLPQAYAHLTTQAQLQALEESLPAQRWVLARRQATVVLATRPQATVLQQPVSAVVTQLDSQIQILQKLVDQPLPSNAHPSVIGQQVTAFMQLDRNEEALRAMRPLTEQPQSVPVVLDYCGLCCQRLEQWQDSQLWYTRSLKFWQQQPAGPQTEAALRSAWKGIAFALRRLDQPAAAEQAYLTALKNVPSAELHFLLAQFYEDQQQTALAAKHARQAVLLSPATYRSPAQELIDRMSHAHIGCLQTSLTSP